MRISKDFLDLGPVESFTRFPALVEVGTGYCYVTRKGKQWRLLSTLCPHAGGEVLWNPEETEFVCPLHGWRFDADGEMGDGCNRLKSYKIKEKKGRLWVKL
jgi:phenylpropionate dioxygenase-like ring-hydroxylating dioxygenase large terminal subunit